MKITQVTVFLFGDGTRVEFLPVIDVPGFTHIVYVLDTANGAFRTLAKDYFSPVAGRISKKSARFYYDKHRSHHA